MKTTPISAILAFLMVFAFFGQVRAQNSENLEFSTFTPTGHTNLLLSSGPRSEFKANATLTLPTSDEKKYPVVVVVPGAGGQVADHLFFWRAKLMAAGIGVVAIDPMRIRNLAPSQSEQLSVAADLVDAIRVLRVLTAHPRVDPERIAILGFSRGGIAAWDSQADAFTTAALGSPSDLRFAAYAALYPACHYTHLEHRKVTTQGLFVLAGADSRTPPEQCQSLVKAASSRGYNTNVTVIEGANHAFDYFIPAFIDTNAFSSKGCRPVVVNPTAPYPRPIYIDDGSPLVAGDGPATVRQILEWSRQCRRPTSALTGNQKTSERENAASTVVDFFVTTLKPKV